jgi:hypothetical protein
VPVPRRARIAAENVERSRHGVIKRLLRIPALCALGFVTLALPRGMPVPTADADKPPLTAADCQKEFVPNNCTWYVAGIRPDVCQWVDRGQGNAYQWSGQARKNGGLLGVQVDSVPEPGDIAVWSPLCAGASWLGHVAYVVNTSSDHKQMYIEEMNWGLDRQGQPVAVESCMRFISLPQPRAPRS